MNSRTLPVLTSIVLVLCVAVQAADLPVTFSAQANRTYGNVWTDPYGAYYKQWFPSGTHTFQDVRFQLGEKVLRIDPNQSIRIEPSGTVQADGIAILASGINLGNQILYIRAEIRTQQGETISVTLPVYEWEIANTTNTRSQIATFPIQANTATGQVCFSKALLVLPIADIVSITFSNPNATAESQSVMIAAVTLIEAQEATPTPTATPTFTATPTSTATASPVATPTPTPRDFLLQNLGVYPVLDFDLPYGVDYGAVPTDELWTGTTDGEGKILTLYPGQGAILMLNRPIAVGTGLVRLSVSVRTNYSVVQCALIAFANTQEYICQGYVNPVNTEVPVDRWGQMRYVFDSPVEEVIPALQFVVGRDEADAPYRVYLDNLEVEPYSTPDLQPVTLQADGSFDTIKSSLLGLNPNSYLPMGGTPGTVSLTEGQSGQGVRLGLAPSQLASHIVMYSLAPEMPTMLWGSVDVKRQQGDQGMLGFVATDADQTLGYFREIRSFPMDVFLNVRMAGNFMVSGKDLPPVAVVQLGGPNVESSIVIDNLHLRKSSFTSDIHGPNITIPLALPDGAKPLEMALIPPGTFMMGSPEEERGRYPEEGPQHEVTITTPFYMGIYEVTQAQWEHVMGSNPAHGYGEGPNVPVYSVSWNDCQAFIAKINEMGLGTFRLPTEAEWEYACRAGTTTRFFFGDVLDCQDGDCPACPLAEQYMWYCTNSYSTAREVGTRLPNPWGLYDIHGNVWEMCQDWLAAYSEESQVDPVGPAEGTNRVIRGGGRNHALQHSRAAHRTYIAPDLTHLSVGFRIICEAKSE
ncbi:MAG TPA: formylglycine-generating enzyme family protein [bacterium]|nr:formylglycine-generating enzyme family protein [bacterium]